MPGEREPRDHVVDAELGSADRIERETLYERCTFRRTNAQGADLSDARFVDCSFLGANLSVVVVRGCSFRNVRFESCKASGVDWSPAQRMASVSFRNCVLDDCAFVRVDLRKLEVRDCSAVNATFSECDLSDAVLCGTDLRDARFAATRLHRADLRGAKGYVLDPRVNPMPGAKVRLLEASGLLAALGLEVE